LFADSEPADWEPDIKLNVYGVLNTTRVVLPGMRERGWGRIIQISSNVAARGVPYGRSLYGMGKAAVEGHLRHLALEVAREGITVNALSLGLMNNAAEYADPEVVAERLATTPMGRTGEPWEVGAAVAWLASEGAAFVTAQVLHVNGGSYQGR
jgi:NAD(P)-dependent dehydrogenase (short-subunit alcohol dehydrogenase family)